MDNEVIMENIVSEFWHVVWHLSSYRYDVAYYVKKLKEIPHQRVIIYSVNDSEFLKLLIACMMTKKEIYVINNRVSELDATQILLNYHAKTALLSSSKDTLVNLGIEYLMPIYEVYPGEGNITEIIDKPNVNNSFNIHFFDENLRENVFSREDVEKIYSEINRTLVGSFGFSTNNARYFLALKNRSDYFIYELFSLIHNKKPLFYDVTTSNKKLKSLSNVKKENILFIEYGLLLEKWNFLVTESFQLNFIFRAFLNKYMKKVVKKLLAHKLKFKGFDKIIILGMPSNSLLIDTLSDWKKVKVYNIFGENNRLMFTNFSDKVGEVCLASNEEVHVANESKLRYITRQKNLLFAKLLVSHPSIENHFLISESYFMQTTATEEKNYAKYCGYKFPKTNNFPHNVESLITELPFIKDCLLIRVHDMNVLVYDLNVDILDSTHKNLTTIRKGLLKYVYYLNNTILKGIIQVDAMRLIPEDCKVYNRFGFLNRQLLYELEDWDKKLRL